MEGRIVNEAGHRWEEQAAQALENGVSFHFKKESDSYQFVEDRLFVDWADQLPDEYEAPDEILQDIFTSGAGSVIYGDSNCGKTFVAIDLSCSIARGVEWMGRKTEPGLVVYLAAESPKSVASRLQAYQRHYGNFDSETRSLLPLKKLYWPL
jgi:RecA-family ATPase